MADFESYEFVIKPKKDGKNKLLRVFLIMFYVAFVMLCLVFGFLTGFVPLLALVPLVLWIIVFFTWRYVNLEYEYLVQSGVMTFTKVYNNRSRRTVLSFDMRSAEYIALATDEETARRVSAFDPRREYSFAIPKNAPGVYTALYLNEDGEKCTVSFVADEKIKKYLKMYNAAALRK